ncbi:GNAT family N-acetyltransferase [Aequorivita sp. SDUM287046]|uniref:GNAT family N-acetyltransferase n=1 Tax=Aequorivita aurantiaca TaxID=3053356 RepID=A0ABT8DK35_9FLAO|nr:GNAT family N-acetyltransferase [Aequorivita aurantiaca]MDN3725184.1 GNAT family N-acetyltransferase [Aequorivita aurantiaca]
MENSEVITNNFSVKKYEASAMGEWDQFIDSAKNATFLFKRNFMDYHSHRFSDFSLMIYKKDSLFAVLPANHCDNILYSHQGLTYGGLISKSANAGTIEDILNAVIYFLRQHAFVAVQLKIMPQFLQIDYHSAQEYFMFQKGADLVRRDMNFIIDLSKKLKLSNSKRIKPNSETANLLEIGVSDDLKTFWDEMLVPGLASTHGVKPVHSLEEIQLLKERFPKNILQYYVYANNAKIAGMLLFVDNGVVKSQYVGSTETGKSFRALEFLYVKLLMKYQTEGFRYFDMGITNTNEGRQYNSGLTRYKEEFGAFAVNMDHFKLNIL